MCKKNLAVSSNMKQKDIQSNKVDQKKLTRKQQLFAKEYLLDLNGTQAAIRSGYSPKSAGEIGCENLMKPEIQQAVQNEMDKRAFRIEITIDKVAQELGLLAFQNAKDFYDDEGNLIPVHKLPDHVSRTISSIEVVTQKNGDEISEYTSKVKTCDKKGSLELLGRHLKMFTDNLNHSGGEDFGLNGAVVTADDKARETRERLLSSLGTPDADDGQE